MTAGKLSLSEEKINQLIILAIERLVALGRVSKSKELGLIQLCLTHKHKLYDDSAFIKAVRTDGTELSKEEKKARGINPRFKVFSSLAHISSDATDHESMLLFIARHVSGYRQFIGCINSDPEVFDTFNVSGCDDGRDCAHIKTIEAVDFNRDNLPQVPLPKCDAAFCRCNYFQRSKKLAWMDEE